MSLAMTAKLKELEERCSALTERLVTLEMQLAEVTKLIANSTRSKVKGAKGKGEGEDDEG